MLLLNLCMLIVLQNRRKNGDFQLTICTKPFIFSLSLEANKYFVEKIAKAYQALTDPVSRENYEKYGHPDGRQVMCSSFLGKQIAACFSIFPCKFYIK